MPILIETVRISNFRSLKNIEAILGPLTVLVGANNCGKTSFLKALNLSIGVERRVITKDDFYIAEKDSGEDKKIRIDIKIIPIDNNGVRGNEFEELWRDVEFGELITLDSKDRQYVAFRTEIAFNVLKNDYEVKRYRIPEWQENSKDWETVEYADSLKAFFPDIPLFFIDAQRDILEDLRNRASYLGKLISKVKIDPEKLKELEGRIKELNDEIVGNSEILSHLKEKLKELSDTIQANGSGIDITPVNKKIRDLSKGLNINFQDGKSESFPLEYHGMGTRSWASLLTFKAYITWLAETYQKEGSNPYHPVLALEEPEAHLHPNAQRHLYSQLTTITGQKIISSHSPYIAGQCQLNQIRLFYKADDSPIISTFDDTGLSPEDIRRLNREILQTKGELFFSKAIVLFEGETEEQAFPIFAKSYWGKHPFELGIDFVGVGGSGNYLPFIRFCESFRIPWYILSDGEDDAIKAVKSALEKAHIDVSKGFPERVKIITKKNNFEKLLIEEKNQSEVKRGILKCLEWTFHSPQHKEAKEREVNGWNDAQILNFMEGNKTMFCSDVAEEIATLADKNRRFPSIIKSAFELISKELNLKIDAANV